MGEMLNIEHAALRLGGRLLFQGFGLAVGAGEWVCVTGGSGCGKTSLLRAVLGFLPLEAGRIRVAGDEVAPHTVERIRRRVAYLPQDLFLQADSVEEMVRIPFQLKANRKAGFSQDGLMALWDELGLEPSLLQRKVEQLSGGQRQRVFLSMAVMLGKPLLLADEPTSGLDAESVARVAALFRRLARRGDAVLGVSHNPVFLGACDRVVNLETGGNGRD